MDIIAQDLAVQARSTALDARIDLARPSRGLSPVGNNAAISTSASASTSTKYQSRMVLYCPKGVKSMSLVFGGVFSSTNSEADITVSAPMNLSYAVVPAPWNPARNYVPGDQVSWYPTLASGYVNNPLFTCLVANSNSMPTPANANWAAGAAVSTNPITVNGQLNCGLSTITKVDGSTVAQGWFQTDPFTPAGAEGECYIEVRSYVPTVGTGSFALGYGQPVASGFYLNSSTGALTDLTGSGYGSVINTPGSCLRPLMALGVPAVADDPRSVAIIGDSISTGLTGYGMTNAWSIASGGTGFTAADIGKVLSSPDTGASAGAVATPARFVIMQVAAGAVTSLRMIDSGCYTNIATNPTQMLPNASQTLTGATVGSGCQISGVAIGSTGFDPGDNCYAQGPFQRALSQAKMRWTAFVSPGDGICNWLTRDHGRLAYLAKSGVSSAIIALHINDVTGGRTAAEIQAAYLRLAKKLKGMGVKGAYLTTMMPAGSSTDGFATLANQTPIAQDAVRQAVNAWIRSVPAPFDGCIDVAAATESGTTGKWVVNGSAGYATIDGKHPSPGGVALAQAVTAAAAAGLK
jgi:hypothetical protein